MGTAATIRQGRRIRPMDSIGVRQIERAAIQRNRGATLRNHCATQSQGWSY
jgi:hypothetical protein